MKAQEMMAGTTESPCGTVSVTVTACCLLNSPSEQGKTQENKEVIVLALIFIWRYLAYQTHQYIQNIPQSIRLYKLAQTYITDEGDFVGVFFNFLVGWGVFGFWFGLVFYPLMLTRQPVQL